MEKNCYITGIGLDHDGFRNDTYRLYMLVTSNGVCFETDEAFFPLGPMDVTPPLRSTDNVIKTTWGSFVPDEGQLARIANTHGANL